MTMRQNRGNPPFVGKTSGGGVVGGGVGIAGTGENSEVHNVLTAGSASGWGSFVEGQGVATGFLSHAEGLAVATGSTAHAEGGDGAQANGDYSHAEGVGVAEGDGSHAEGSSRTGADATDAHAEGSNNDATGGASHAEGSATNATGYASHSEGTTTNATGQASHAEGTDTVAIGQASHAEGSTTTASGIGAHAEGNSNVSSGAYAHAEGTNNVAAGVSSHAGGNGNVAHYAQNVTGLFAVDDAIGNTTLTAGQFLFKIGNGADALNRKDAFRVSFTGGISSSYTAAAGARATALGSSTTSPGENATSFGELGRANGKNSLVGGLNNIAHFGQTIVGQFAVDDAISDTAFVAGEWLFKIGGGTSAEARADMFRVSALGAISNSTCTATGVKSVALGKSTKATGIQCFASGDSCEATGENAFAANLFCKATGIAAFACNDYTIASGFGAFACGANGNGSVENAWGVFSFAAGIGNSTRYLQAIFGSYAKIDTTPRTNENSPLWTMPAFPGQPILKVGCGIDGTNRDDAFTVNQYGQAAAKQFGFLGIKSVTANYSVLPEDGLVRATAFGPSIDVTLPLATGSGRMVKVKAAFGGSGAINVLRSGTNTIDGNVTVNVPVPDCFTFCDSVAGMWELV